MNTHFTFMERTKGLFNAGRLVSMLLLGVGIIATFTGILSGTLGLAYLACIFLLIGVPIAFIACQVFGQPIWLTVDLLGRNSEYMAILFGMVTGIAMQVSFSLFFTKQIVLFAISTPVLMLVGGCCGLFAFKEAQLLRNERLTP